MAKQNALVHSFNSGEVSVAALARVDYEGLRLAAETQENIFPFVIGKGMMRPGTTYLGNSKSNNQARGIPFVKATDDVAEIELTDSLMRVWVNDALVTRPSVTCTVPEGDFSVASTDLMQAASLTSSTLASGTLANLTDGDATAGSGSEDQNPSTVASWNATATGTLTADLGSAHTVRWLWLTAGVAAGNLNTRAPSAFTVTGSNTGSFSGEQTTILTVSGAAAWGGTEERHYQITSPGSYRYYRISMTNTSAGAGFYVLASVVMLETQWNLGRTGYAVLSISSNQLSLSCPKRGTIATAIATVTTSSANIQHALRIVVATGPVIFRCGSSSGIDDYISETELDVGIHSLTLTPTGTFYIEFLTRREILTVVSSCTIEAAGVMEIAAPWAASELRQIQYDQSGDIIFLAHTNWQQRKIERRSTTSWSLVKYKSDDGPFTTARTAKVRLKPAQTYGNTTLTADDNFFKATHVGALFRLNQNKIEASWLLGGDGAATDAWRVSGTGADNDFTYTVTGNFVGTLTMQRSYDSADTGFIDTATTLSVTASATTFSTAADNVTAWYRWIFNPGDYTVGWVSIAIVYKGNTSAGVARVTAYNSPTSVNIEVLSNFNNTDYTDDWTEGEWSDRRGWPSAVSFHDGRLGWSRLGRFWLSESDDFTAFNLTTVGDAESIQRDIATSGAFNKTLWMLSLQRLIFGTGGSEASARASAFDEPLTPTNTSLKDASTQGVAAVAPVKIDKHAIYVQRSGVRLYELAYNFNAQDYDSSNLMKLNETIGGDGSGYSLVELSARRQPETYVFAVRSDGQVVILLYEPREKVTGFIRFVTAGTVESICVLPGLVEDAVYLWVNRTINGATVRFHEKLALRTEAIGSATTKLADAGIFTAGPVSTVAATHLASATGLVGWGTTGGVSKPITGLSADGSGNVALGASYTNVFVGMGYTGKYKSAKLAYGAQKGTALLTKKIVSMVGLLLADTHRNAIQFGPSFTKLKSFILKGTNGQALTDANAVISSHDDVLKPHDGEWNTDSRVCIQISPGYPATLLGLVLATDTNEQ